MKLKKILMALMGLLGLSIGHSPKSGTDILKAKLNLKETTFAQSGHGTQDFTKT